MLTEADPLPRVSRLAKPTTAAGMDMQAFPLSRIEVYWHGW
jgi:hypothetical protein